ncbi:hypothetical protein WA158_004595 [Blastocystis sp. Blastoise]
MDNEPNHSLRQDDFAKDKRKKKTILPDLPVVSDSDDIRSQETLVTTKESPKTIEQVQSPPLVKIDPVDVPYQLIGNRKTALVVITYNRPDYLSRTMNKVFEILNSEFNNYKIDLFVSQDGNSANMNNVIKEIETKVKQVSCITKYSHYNHPQETLPGDTSYHKLSRHFKWIFDKVFEQGYDQIIVLEDDLEIAIDFFEYFAGVSPLVWEDDSIYAASAWNDNGFNQYVSNPETLYRSDFFPGLGWLLTSRLWSEVGPIWPAAYWDDWLRHPLRRQGRAVIRPEISRTYTFGKSGVSQSQFFDQYLAPIKLNTDFVPFSMIPLSYLKKLTYDIGLKDAIGKAVEITYSPGFEKSLNPSNEYKIFYRDDKNGYKSIAKKMGLMPDSKAGVPRGAYMGVVPLTINGIRVYIVPQSGPSFNYIED